EGQRDASRPDAQLQGPALAGEFRKHIDRRVHDGRLERVRRRFVVAGRDTLAEVAVLIVHRRTVPQETCPTPPGFRAGGGGGPVRRGGPVWGKKGRPDRMGPL